jgi:hypothetical protein
VSPYRYVLRRGGSVEPLALWVMLNPSTADETNDDPTIRRVIAFTARFAERSGVVPWRRGFTVVNLFALRATDPKVLTGSASDVGAHNDEVIAEEAAKASLIICAWGAHPVAVARVEPVLALLGGGAKWCLGKTKSGAPRHPLYVRGDQPLEVFR